MSTISINTRKPSCLTRLLRGYIILFSLFSLTDLLCNTSREQFNRYLVVATRQLPTGPLSTSLSAPDLIRLSEEVKPNSAPAPSLNSPKQVKLQQNQLLRTAAKPSTEQPRKGDKKRETLSTDCVAKKNEILLKQQRHSNAQVRSTQQHGTLHDNPLPTGFQRLKPKLAHNDTSDSNLESEFVPTCTDNGKYEPIQCHKIGYCWCVNKFGQAIKNSATSGGEKPFCDLSIYDSDNNDFLVVTGVSASRLKNLLKPHGATNSNSSAQTNSDSDIEPPYSDTDSKDSADFNKRVNSSQEPSLALVENECTMSREKALERASRHTDDSIWIPECDVKHNKLYAEKQCHKSKVCWCVDQVTGLPLRTSEQLKKETTINCTEIRRIIDQASSVFNQPKLQSSHFNGFSESCDAEQRVEFVLSIINQFRRQISEYMKVDSNYVPPAGLPTLNPFRLSENQVSSWKFSTMDQDMNGKLDEREWNKFKMNFKLVDRFEEIYKSHKPDTDSQFAVVPLNIVRPQRRCWRDFLQFCGNGDFLTNESIGLSSWLSCTEIPSKLDSFGIDDGRGRVAGSEPETTPVANTVAAAIARSKKKNPFLGILRPD